MVEGPSYSGGIFFYVLFPLQLHLYFRCMIDVFYPYFAREAIWEELRYSLRSLEKHFKQDFRVWIVGDLPVWAINIRHIPHTRSEGMRENSTYDAIKKLILFCEHWDTSDLFIRMYDDMYLIEDVTLEDLSQYKAMFGYAAIPKRDGVWWDQLRRTLLEVIKKGYPGWNTETHFPEVFEKINMLDIIEDYDALNKRLLTSSLYFNIVFSQERPVFFHECRGIQFYNNEDNKYYTSSTGDLHKKCTGMRFLNHNNSGLNDNLKQFLMDRFAEKSRFER